MAAEKYVSYLRVSTDRQGRSGLGLEAQREAVSGYLNGGHWKLIAEFVEVESGRRSDRPELERALGLCRAHRATLVVARLDRLTRSVSFLSKLLEASVPLAFVDMPQLEGPTGRFMLQQMAAVAELEAGLIGDRTRKALAAAKSRGVSLGGFRGRAGTPEDCMRARAEKTRRADEQARALTPILARLDWERSESLRRVAAALNAEGVPTPGGRGRWTAATVARVRRRIEAVA